MAETQLPLFGDEAARAGGERDLVVRPQRARPLTKAQQTFNRRVKRVEDLRMKFDLETQRLNAALAYYGEHLHPRLARALALRKELVRAIAPFLDDKRLKQQKSDRKTLRALLAEQIEYILGEEGSLVDDDIRALFKRVSGIDVDKRERLEQDQVNRAFSEMERMFEQAGIDVDFSGMRADMTDDELAAKAAELANTIQQQATQQEEASQGRKRPRTKRQLEQESRRRQAEELRNKSIASMYKQLARALHPDLEPDAELRERKGALMQELTAAYRNNDLHTLLRLELEWIHREEGDLERLSDEKLAVYNQVLKEQAEELEDELEMLPMHPRYQPLVCFDGPFDFSLRTDGRAEARVLDKMISDMELSLSRFRSDAAFNEVRGAIRAYRTL